MLSSTTLKNVLKPSLLQTWVVSCFQKFQIAVPRLELTWERKGAWLFVELVTSAGSSIWVLGFELHWRVLQVKTTVGEAWLFPVTAWPEGLRIALPSCSYSMLMYPLIIFTNINLTNKLDLNHQHLQKKVWWFISIFRCIELRSYPFFSLE